MLDVAASHAPKNDARDCLTAYEAAMEAVAVIENMAKTLVPAMAEEIRAFRMPHAAALLESIAKEAP